MAGMQRFVTYIYAYENGQKSGNTGYAKIETRGNSGRMEIHFASDVAAGGEVAASFLYIEGGKMHAIPLGELRLENGRGMGQFTFHTETMQDTGISFEKIDGIGLTDSNNRQYMSFWKDVKVRVEPRVQDTEPIQKEILEDAEQESLHTMEIPMRNVFPNYTMTDIWRSMEKNRTCVQINDEVDAIQIELSDLRELPRKYWYLGNNSFLLHGFFNYRHLLFGRLPDERWFLGVPGVYERQERVMASVFGFPGFMHIAEPAQAYEQLAQQKSPYEMQQGIWYHILED